MDTLPLELENIILDYKKQLEENIIEITFMDKVKWYGKYYTKNNIIKSGFNIYCNVLINIFADSEGSYRYN